jgi:hypothetical protein
MTMETESTVVDIELTHKAVISILSLTIVL